MWMHDNSLFVPVVNPNTAKARTMPEIRDVAERTGDFETIEATYSPIQAAEEAARCLKCPTHWCELACPAHVPVTDFIALTRAGKYEEAYQLIRTQSMLPELCSRVCPQEKQCQSNCTRSIRSMAVGIGKLERFVVDQHYASGAAEKTAEPTGKKIAVIGSGPAGLGAAQRLADQGHSVTVYEKSDRIGGLSEYGIPNMKLNKAVIDRKVDAMKQQGVTFVMNTEVGKTVSAEEIVSGNDAVILAVGTGNARKLNPEGAEGVTGIVPAVDFLSEATKAMLNGEMAETAKGKHVVIVGGGDTGNDCVGTSIRQGAVSITQIEMMPEKTGRQIIFEPHPARPAEQKHDFSQEECAAVFGDPHVYQTTVKAVQADENGKIVSVTTVALNAEYGEHFKLNLSEIPGSEQTIPCDLLVVAAGFIGPEASVPAAFGVAVNARTNVDAPEYVADGKIFACGDCRTGQSLVVKAMADGRDCADAVDAFLKK